MEKKFLDVLEDSPIVAGIKSDEDLELVINTNCKAVFVLYGSILTINNITNKLKEHGKIVFVNIDLIDGFACKDVVIEYLKQSSNIDGILSSKAPILRKAKSLGFLTIHRLFIIDSFSFHSIQKQVKISNPTCIEILPGCMPKALSWIQEKTPIPIIAGGLVCEKDDVVSALGAGAIAVSSTNHQVWSM